MSDESDPPEPSTPPCATCGERIPADAPQGLCPKCVLKLVASPSAPGAASSALLRFQPPEIEEVRAAFPQYEIVDLIGCGGMGAVFRARQPHLDRLVALKILPPDLAALPEFADRFLREGQVLAKLNHPNIVSIFDFGESAGLFYLLMEYIDGANLREAMRAGRFSPEQALQIVPQVCEALQFAHDEGVLHRDIKPENILLDAKGRVKIADFGIAKLFGESAGPGLGLTRGAVPGTPHYMAPEQIEHTAEIDHRADIYSLGVVFYEMLTGELPIGRFAAPSERANVGSEIDEIVFRSLEKERGRRQQSAREVRTEVIGAAHATGPDRTTPTAASAKPPSTLPAPPSGDAELRARWERQVRPGLALALVFGGVAVLLLLGYVRVKLVEESQALRAEKSKTASMLEEGTDAFGVESLDAELALPTKQSTELERERWPQTGTPVDLAFRIGPPLLTTCGLLMLCIPPGIVFAWKQLKLAKMLWLPRGRLRLLAAAWFWPLIGVYALSELTFLAVRITPAGFLATPFAIVLAFLFGSLLLFLTLLWVRRPVHGEFVRMYLERLDELRARARWHQPMAGWAAVSFALVLSYPAAVALGLLLRDPRFVGIEAREGVTSAAVILVSGAYLLLINRAYHPPSGSAGPEEVSRR